MAFDARIRLQGAISYVPHTDGKRLLALFPAHPSDPASILDPEGKAIERHYAVIQCWGGLLGLPDVWTTLDISGLWVGLDAPEAPPMSLGEEPISLIPSIVSILGPDDLAAYASVSPQSLPGAGFDSGLLRAGVYLDKGRVFGDRHFLTRCDLRGGDGQNLGSLGDLSNTAIVALDGIGSLALRLRTLDGQDLPSLTIHAPDAGDRAEIWIRHFCDLAEPDPGEYPVDPDDRLDRDFVLNYTLLENAATMIDERDRYRLPAPMVNENWAEGDNRAGRPNNCAGPIDPGKSFSSPFE